MRKVARNEVYPRQFGHGTVRQKENDPHFIWSYHIAHYPLAAVDKAAPCFTVQSRDTARGQGKLDVELTVHMFDTNGSLGWRSLTRVQRRPRTGSVTDVGDGPRLFIAPDRRRQAASPTRWRVRCLIDPMQ